MLQRDHHCLPSAFCSSDLISLDGVICLHIQMLVSPSSIFTDMPMVLPASRASLGPVKQHKTINFTDRLKELRLPCPPCPSFQWLGQEYGIFGGGFNSSGAASGALFKGFCQCSETQEEWRLAKERLAWAKGLHLPCVCRHVIRCCWWGRLKLHLAVNAPSGCCAEVH